MRDWLPTCPLLPVYLLSVVSVGSVKAPFPLGQFEAVHVVAFQLPAGASYQPAYVRHAFFRSLHISAGLWQGRCPAFWRTLLSGVYKMCLIAVHKWELEHICRDTFFPNLGIFFFCSYTGRSALILGFILLVSLWLRFVSPHRIFPFESMRFMQLFSRQRWGTDISS